MKKVLHRALGAQGLSVGPIGLGCMSLSGIYGAANDTESEDLIRQAIDRGIDHLDSSDMYGWGHNEEVVGRAIKGRRDRVVLVLNLVRCAATARPTVSMAGRSMSLRRVRPA